MTSVFDYYFGAECAECWMLSVINYYFGAECAEYWYVPMYECVTHTHVCITVSHDSTNKHQCILNRLRVRTSRLLHGVMNRMKQMLSF